MFTGAVLDGVAENMPMLIINRILLDVGLRFANQMRGKLSGGHFRMLNEKLYTCSGNEAFNFFKNEPELFNVYHAGYQEQMSHWPEQPVNIIANWLKNHNSSFIAADFGCGNPILARSVKNKVFSIDLVATDPSVIACDMSHTPLGSSSVDVAVFCLSLPARSQQSSQATRLAIDSRSA